MAERPRGRGELWRMGKGELEEHFCRLYRKGLMMGAVEGMFPRGTLARHDVGIFETERFEAMVERMDKAVHVTCWEKGGRLVQKLVVVQKDPNRPVAWEELRGLVGSLECESGAEGEVSAAKLLAGLVDDPRWEASVWAGAQLIGEMARGEAEVELFEKCVGRLGDPNEVDWYKASDGGRYHEATLLHMAVAEGLVEAARVLLERGLEPGAVAEWAPVIDRRIRKVTVIEIAEERGDLGMIELLRGFQSENWKFW